MAGAQDVGTSRHHDDNGYRSKYTGRPTAPSLGLFHGLTIPTPAGARHRLCQLACVNRHWPRRAVREFEPTVIVDTRDPRGARPSSRPRHGRRFHVPPPPGPLSGDPQSWAPHPSGWPPQIFLARDSLVSDLYGSSFQPILHRREDFSRRLWNPSPGPEQLSPAEGRIGESWCPALRGRRPRKRRRALPPATSVGVCPAARRTASARLILPGTERYGGKP